MCYEINFLFVSFEQKIQIFNCIIPPPQKKKKDELNGLERPNLLQG